MPSFILPEGLSAEALRELERACLTGGPDNMPTPTDIALTDGQMTTRRPADDSGWLLAPWEVAGFGRLMGSSATLMMTRAHPYHLVTELARGKVNQLRNEAVNWRAGGLMISDALQSAIDAAGAAFGRAVTTPPSPEAQQLAQEALRQGCDASAQLVGAYIEQVFQIRHQRSPKLDTTLGCRVTPTEAGPPPTKLGQAVLGACNSLSIPFFWSEIEPEQGQHNWKPHDELLNWALAANVPVTAGPLIDFSSVMLPAWLWLYERDVTTLATFMCRYVEVTVRRYKQRIRRWQLSAGANCAAVLGLTEDELLGLTYRLAETARQVDPSLELILGISQPWGEYLAVHDYTHSPFIFADNLIRSGLGNLAALDVELVMGVDPRGSYCRDLLDTSRVLDLYALLGLPLRVTIGYPAHDAADPDADPETRIGAGRWLDGYTPQTQAEWATAFGALALCKPYVHSVQWTHLSDAVPHQFPHSGLADSGAAPRPALDRLRQLREQHLR